VGKKTAPYGKARFEGAGAGVPGKENVARCTGRAKHVVVGEQSDPEHVRRRGPRGGMTIVEVLSLEKPDARVKGECH